MQEVVGMGENLPPMPSISRPKPPACTAAKAPCICSAFATATAWISWPTAMRPGPRIDRHPPARLFRSAAKDVLAFDVEKFLHRIGLEDAPEHGPAKRPGRHDQKVRELAAGIAATGD
jgi:hypothetical protein